MPQAKAKMNFQTIMKKLFKNTAVFLYISALFIPFICLLIIISKNIYSNGFGINFDDLSYIAVFRDLLDSSHVTSPFTTPKVLPILVLGSIFQLFKSLTIIAIVQAIIGCLLIFSIYRFGRLLGVSKIFALSAVSIFLIYNLLEVGIGNATIMAAFFFMMGLNRYLLLI